MVETVELYYSPREVRSKTKNIRRVAFAETYPTPDLLGVGCDCERVVKRVVDGLSV